MNPEKITTAFVFVLIFVVFVITISSVIHSTRKARDRKLDEAISYAECLTKTSDIEWCVERSFGIELRER